MAMSVWLKPPETIDLSKPNNWEKLKKRFEQSRVAAGLKDENETRQVSIPLYCMEEESNLVLSSTGITDADRKIYNAMMAKFNAFFEVRRNVIFERGRIGRAIHHCALHLCENLRLRNAQG